MRRKLLPILAVLLLTWIPNSFFMVDYEPEHSFIFLAFSLGFNLLIFHELFKFFKLKDQTKELSKPFKLIFSGYSVLLIVCLLILFALKRSEMTPDVGMIIGFFYLIGGILALIGLMQLGLKMMKITELQFQGMVLFISPILSTGLIVVELYYVTGYLNFVSSLTETIEMVSIASIYFIYQNRSITFSNNQTDSLLDNLEE